VFHYPQTTELDERGRNAAGHQIFVSIHHNAFGDPSVQGTEVLVGTQNQSAADQSLAKAINARIVQELWGSQPGERDRGAKAQSLGVLRNAPASVYAKCLTEAFFITGGSMTPSMARTFVDRSARAMAGALETFWLSSRTKMTALGAPVAADPGFEPWPEAQDELGIYSDH
jgi:N-acetylmuramoyl-L-alanine amidase